MDTKSVPVKAKNNLRLMKVLLYGLAEINLKRLDGRGNEMIKVLEDSVNGQS